MIEKVRKRNYYLEIENYDQNFENEEKYVVYSDIKPLRFFKVYKEYGGWTTEKYLVAQDGKLYIITQYWSSVYNCASFEIEKVLTDDPGDISKIIEKLKEDK